MAGNQGVAYKKVQHVPAALEKQPPTRPPSAANVFNRSAAPIIDMREVYFLVAHFLSSGPCVKAAELLKQELREHDLLPRRGHAFYSNSGVPSELVGDNGRTLSVPYEEVAARYKSKST